MGRFRGIGRERDIELYMDVDRFVWVCCIPEYRVRIPQVDDMIYRMYGIHRAGVYRIFDHMKLGLGNIGHS
jgi:hypothetical protein